MDHYNIAAPQWSKAAYKCQACQSASPPVRQRSPGSPGPPVVARVRQWTSMVPGILGPPGPPGAPFRGTVQQGVSLGGDVPARSGVYSPFEGFSVYFGRTDKRAHGYISAGNRSDKRATSLFLTSLGIVLSAANSAG